MSIVQVTDADIADLKQWLQKKLEDISDADTDVLADYVIALIRSDEPVAQIRTNCIEQLEDFLHAHAQGFVEDVFKALHSKSYKPGYKPPPPKANALPGLNSSATPFKPQSFPKAASSVQPLTATFSTQPQVLAQPQQINGQQNQSKKRSFGNTDMGSQPNQGSSPQRAQKQMRRGGLDTRGDGAGRGGRGGRGGGIQQPQPQPQQHIQQIPGIPQIPQWDPNNPMAAVMAMQKAMGLPLPGFEQMQGFQPPAQQTPQPKRRRGRCRDYDNKGFCAKGTMCPYEHGSNHMVVTEPYDPTNAALALKSSQSPTPIIPHPHPQAPPSSHPFPTSSSARSQHTSIRGTPSTRARNHRASFSASGPNHDTRNASIVVEQIPEDKFTNSALHTFFSAFGPISDINLQAFKRLAVIKFESYDGAKRAYESPKVIFDNRFVKVYWYRPGSDQVQQGTLAAMEGRGPTTENGAGTGRYRNGDIKMEEAHANVKLEDANAEEETPSAEEVAIRQAEAQRTYEAKAKKLKEAEDAKTEIDAQLRAAAEERRKLKERLAAKTGKAVTPAPTPDANAKANGANGTPARATRDAEKAKATDALRAKLAALEAEAEAMGLPIEESAPFPPYTGYAPRGRGGFRGRGSGRGRGGFAAQPAWWQGGSVQRLDNRPKTVCVRLLDEESEFGDEANERLRGFLYGIGAFAAITPVVPSDPTVKQTGMHVTFYERYVAEMLLNSTMHTGGSIPGLGKVELTWVMTPVASLTNGASNGAVEAKKADVDISGAGDGAEVQEEGEVDYDVADEDDQERWMR